MKPLFKYLFPALSVLVILLLSGTKQGFSQDSFSGDLFLLQGRVLTSDSLLPIEHAHIISKFNRWGTISDEKGDFAMLVSKKDSLLITSVGFRSLVLILDDSVEHLPPPFLIYMLRDTILINEFVVHAFWDYNTFKQMVLEMKPIEFDYSRVDFEENLMLSLPPGGAGMPGPVSLLFGYFNHEERLRRTLLRNRKKYNQRMIDMGRPQDTIPAIPEHMQESPR